MTEKKFDFRNLKRPSGGQLILLAVGLLMAVALFIFMRGFVACWQLTSLPGIPPPSCAISAANPRVTPGANSEGTPGTPASSSTSSAPQVQMPPPWDGASRVNIVFLGLRGGEVSGEGCPLCTDTIIILTIDPQSMTAGMFSIPRDMWVNIPGFSYAKINTAYTLGEAYKLPGGGPGLAIKTVENFLGVTINYYAQIDFNAFERMIDEIGGLDLEVSETITLDPLGKHNTFYDLPPGNYHFDGPMVLAYSRSRDTEGGDVDRANRQQQVIFAIRDKVLSLNMLPTLVAKAPALYQELSAGIHANMSLDDALRLVMLARQIPLYSIKKGVIDYTMMTDAKSPEGLDITRPFSDKVRVLRDEIFGSGALSPMATGDQAQLLQDEAARVVVLNSGSGITGLAQSASDYLTSQGMNVVLIGNTIDHPEYPIFYSPEGYTTVVDYSGKPYALRYLMSTMGLGSGQIRIKYDPNAQADVIIFLRGDWRP